MVSGPQGGALIPRTWRRRCPQREPCGRRQAKRGQPQCKWFLCSPCAGPDASVGASPCLGVPRLGKWADRASWAWERRGLPRHTPASTEGKTRTLRSLSLESYCLFCLPFRHQICSCALSVTCPFQLSPFPAEQTQAGL